MIRPANTIERVLAYSKPVDFRKAVDGLSVIVEEALDENPYSGTLFVFTNRQRDKVKILCWERSGIRVVTLTPILKPQLLNPNS